MVADEDLSKIKRHQAGRFQEYVDRDTLEDQDLYSKVKLVSFPGNSLLKIQDYREVNIKRTLKLKFQKEYAFQMGTLVLRG